jgi:phosphatidate cytidylyltransferase
MLRTRLWAGALLIALAAGVLLVDEQLAPWYPFLAVLVLVLAFLACYELLQLLAVHGRPVAWLSYTAVVAMLMCNWLPELLPGPSRWSWIAGCFAAAVLGFFLVEMATYQTPGSSMPRIALGLFIVAYAGLLPCFLLQLRWLNEAGWSVRGATAALTLAIFVPKCCDIGAYFTGRFLGRHRMAPVLSPKKTWEGAAGGVVAGALAAVGIDRQGPVLGSALPAAGLGLALAVVGILGDLAESLLKRDCQRKDASAIMPGFGGVLDVIDSILFAAPVAYWCIHCKTP